MSSAYGIQRQRRGWIDPTDQDFTLKALMFKQQKYDANQAKVQSIIEQYKSLQLVRGVDRDYLNKRLTYLVDNVNQFGPQDFSSNAVTQSIQHHLGQVLDDNVMTAAQETAKIRKYQEEVEKIKEKNPELYNTLNEAYGMAPAQEYMQNTEVGAKIKGGLTYTPYKDIEGELQKTLLDIQKNSKNGSYQYEVSPGRLMQVTVNGKSAAELREIALGLMGDKYNQQFTINSWGKYGGFKNIEGAQENMNSYYSNLINAHTQDIEGYKAQLSGGRLSDSKVGELQEKIKNLENQKLTIQNNLSSFQKDPISGLVAMEKDNVASRLGKSLGLLQVKSMEYKKDDYFFAMENLNLSKAQFEQQKAKDAAELAFNERKWEDEKGLKLLELEAKAAGKNADGTGNGSSGNGTTGMGSAVTTSGLNLEGKDYDKQLESDHKQILIKLNKDREEMFQTGRTVISTISQIASGQLRNVDSDTKTQATQLINLFKSQNKNADLNNLNTQQIYNFMRLYSQSNTYEALDFLPIVGSKSVTGERPGSVSLKSTWTDQYNRYNINSKSYNEARNQALADNKKAGVNESITKNAGFKDYLSRSLPLIGRSQLFTIGMGKGDITNLNKLMNAEGLDKEGMAQAVENGGMSFQLVENGTKIALRYQTSGKDDEKKSVLSNTDVQLVSVENFKKFFPDAERYINLSSKQPIYTHQNFGTREFVSRRIGYVPSNSKYLDAYTQEARSMLTNPNDARFLTKDETKDILRSAAPKFANAEANKQVQRIIDVVSSPSNLNDLNVVIQHLPSYDGSGQSNIVVSLVESNSKMRVITQNIGHKSNPDELVRINERNPQILFGQLLKGELEKLKMDNTGKLIIPEGIDTLLKFSHVNID